MACCAPQRDTKGKLIMIIYKYGKIERIGAKWRESEAIRLLLQAPGKATPAAIREQAWWDMKAAGVRQDRRSAPERRRKDWSGTQVLKALIVELIT